MGNPRLHISPLASERQTADASGTLIAEARGINGFLRQFVPNVFLADNNRLIYGLTAIEDAPLPDDLPKLTPRSSIYDGNAVSRAVSGVELAFTKFRPFEHGEHAENTQSGEMIEVPAFHMGPIATRQFEVLPSDSDCTSYTVAGGNYFADNPIGTSERVSVDVPGVTLDAPAEPTDQVVYLSIPCVYGLGLPYDPGIPEQYQQITFPESAGEPIIGISRSIFGSFDFLPRQTTSGYPNPGLIYVALAFVNGDKILQPDDSFGPFRFFFHIYSKPYR